MAAGPPVLRFPRGLPHSKQFGERLRLLVIQGPDKGVCYTLLGDFLFVGREGAQVLLNDENISRKHAELNWKGDHYNLRDLGSSNGIVHNGQKVTEAKLSPGDLVLVGLSVLEVYGPGQTRKNEAPQIKSLARKTAPAPGASPGVSALPGEEKKKKEVDKKRLFVYLILFFVVYLAFFSEEGRIETFRERAKIQAPEDEQPKKPLSKKDIKDAIADFIPDYSLDTQQRKDAEVFFRSGVRELQNKNYRRAITAFQTAITVDGDHSLAKIYLKTANKEMQTEIRNIARAALRAKKSLRYKEARMHYENIIRYLGGDIGNNILENEMSKIYKKAQEELELLDKEENRLR